MQRCNMATKKQAFTAVVLCCLALALCVFLVVVVAWS